LLDARLTRPPQTRSGKGFAVGPHQRVMATMAYLQVFRSL
jgi:hypothetical protein